MAERKSWHQLDPVKMSRRTFEGLPYRTDVKGEKYEEGKRYRDHNYPNDVFIWEAYPKGSETKGEWQMGAADTGDEE